MGPAIRSIAVVCGCLILLQVGGLAKPEYADKEKKECAFCHVNAAGGGDPNSHGQYYARNNHSLKGLPLQFKSLWKLAAPPEARRLGLGDVMGAKKPQVLILGASDELTVYAVNGEALTKQASVKLGPRASEFAVGTLQKEKPAMIAVPGAVFYRSGEEFAQIKAPSLSSISGIVRFVDGEECVFYFDGMSEPTVYGVNVGAANPLTIGQSMVMPDQGAGVYSWIVARFPIETITALGWPPEVAKSPAIGLWDARHDETVTGWAIWSDAKTSKLVLIDPGRVLGGGEFKPMWSSEPLSGKALDIALGTDPKDGKTPGFLILTATGEDGKGRTLEFLGLD